MLLTLRAVHAHGSPTGYYYPQQQLAYAQQPAQMQMLPEFSVNGGLEVPDHPPGMKYVKTDPFGSFEVTTPDGNSLGRVHVSSHAWVRLCPDPPRCLASGVGSACVLVCVCLCVYLCGRTLALHCDAAHLVAGAWRLDAKRWIGEMAEGGGRRDDHRLCLAHTAFRRQPASPLSHTLTVSRFLCLKRSPAPL